MNDQLYHYYLGDPIELLLLYESGKSDLVKVGPDIANGQNVQLFIPGGTFHTARLIAGGRWFLAARPNGPAWWWRKMSNSATPKRSRRNSPTAPPRSARSLCRRRNER